jgi:hypothetical protein
MVEHFHTIEAAPNLDIADYIDERGKATVFVGVKNRLSIASGCSHGGAKPSNTHGLDARISLMALGGIPSL